VFGQREADVYNSEKTVGTAMRLKSGRRKKRKMLQCHCATGEKKPGDRYGVKDGQGDAMAKKGKRGQRGTWA